jgi:hypothetical protein
MDRTRLPGGDEPRSLRLPAGTRIVHIGPPKTGTTAIQAAMWAVRPELLRQDVRLVGWSRNPARAAQAVTRRVPPGSAVPPGIGPWKRLLGEFARAREARVIVSSEHFAWADAEAVRRIRDDLGPSRVHVIVTLRPLVRILPSNYQQVVQAGGRDSFGGFLTRLFRPAPDQAPHEFWQRQRHDWYLQRHDELLARWAGIVGPDQVTAVVVDDADHGFLFRVFESLLGLRSGTLQPVPNLTNRSLTLPEAEGIRAFNAEFWREGLSRPLHMRVVREATSVMRRREPPADEPRLIVPVWARVRAELVAREMVAAIASSGVRVVGDLSTLVTSDPGGRRDGPRDPNAARLERAPWEASAPDRSAADESVIEVTIPPVIAGRMALGVLHAVGGLRSAETVRAGGRLRRLAWGVTDRMRIAEPLDIARIPTVQLTGIVVRRVRQAAVARARRRPAPGEGA